MLAGMAVEASAGESQSPAPMALPSAIHGRGPRSYPPIDALSSSIKPPPEDHINFVPIMDPTDVPVVAPPIAAEMPALSAKALGKRPERFSSSVPSAPSPLNPNMPSNLKAGPPSKSKAPKLQATPVPSTEETTTKRRVLPARSRRGGPGIGSSPVDAMILESLQRSAETQYIVSPFATFLLTTDASSAPQSSTSASSSAPHTSHFDKPEVVRNTQIQQLIETPSFSLLDNTMVGSRLRVRGGDEEAADISDASYERRHRKYESFEKRLRRREKEKLQHEHHKLKERIEELKVMDVSSFSIGGLTFPEAEDKKRVMLKEAEDLDRRYTILLPAEKKGISSGGTKDPDVLLDMDDELSLASIGTEPKIRLRIRRGLRPSSHTDDISADGEGLRDDDDDKAAFEDEMLLPTILDDEMLPQTSLPLTPVRKPNSPSKPLVAIIREPLGQPPPKRTRIQKSYTKTTIVSHHTSASTPVRPPGWIPVILRNPPPPNANKTTSFSLRRSMPFNVKISPMVDVKKEFELPRYILREYEDRHVTDGEGHGMDIDETHNPPS